MPDLCLHARTEEHLETVAAVWLETRGWKLAPPGSADLVRWERKTAFCRRLSIPSRTLRRWLKGWHPTVKLAPGMIGVTVEFESWARLKRERGQPGNATETPSGASADAGG